MQRKRQVPLSELEDFLRETRPARDFRMALRCPGISLIAEIKKASPTRGNLREDLDPVGLATLYEQTGARAISILTDERYFKGSLVDLSEVRRNTNLPCLRKEFILDDYQIVEARVAGADAILLIVRILSDKQLADYIQVAQQLGMAALVETHTEQEIERAIEAGAHIIGINNRDLDTFTVDINTTLRLKRLVPGGHVLVSESGISSRKHVQLLEDGGVDAILVGEALVTSNDIAAKVRELLGVGES
ncbi:MAG TPA: indole-3-glycerol phosphate synthase TrpC [Candidatus Hydrogenedentes bacterium]|nr:indole-3-glycerol phosphate synthase TrpC [Candidatus Hydrogenedentota bacterium]